MRRSFLALPFCALVAAGDALAAEPDSCTVEPLGWDPVDRKVWIAQHGMEGGRWLPVRIGFYLLDGDDPGLLQPLRDPVEEVAAARDGVPVLTWLRRSLDPLPELALPPSAEGGPRGAWEVPGTGFALLVYAAPRAEQAPLEHPELIRPVPEASPDLASLTAPRPW